VLFTLFAAYIVLPSAEATSTGIDGMNSFCDETNSVKSPFRSRIFILFIPFSAVTNPCGITAKCAGLQHPQNAPGAVPGSPNCESFLPSVVHVSILLCPVFAANSWSSDKATSK